VTEVRASVHSRLSDLQAHLAEQSPAALWVLDARGRCVYCNEAFCALTGFERGRGDVGRWLARQIPGEDRRRVWPAIEAAKARRAPFEIEYRLRTPDGGYRRLLQRSVPLLAPDGTLEGYAGTAFDVTALREREQQLLDDNRAQVELLGLLAHELATPLTAVKGFAQRLQRGEAGEPERAEAVAAIVAESERLEGLVVSMSALGRLDRDRSHVEPQLLQRLLPRIVPPVVERLACRVALAIPGDLPPVLANETWLEQVLENLLSNAAKYGSGTAGVELRASFEDARVAVRVLDRGAGIEAGEAERLFEPFYRSPRNRAGAAGAGLGLAVCRRLIEAQGGEVWARPRSGGGSEFGFSLRIAEPDGAG
jgi:PAS domain S-box-containing protein